MRLMNELDLLFSSLVTLYIRQATGEVISQRK